MSQNTPPNVPHDGGNNNPYYQQQGPDLDSGTPVLRDEEQQRLNRKAMFFLGGTLGLVILMAVLVLSGGDEDAPTVAQAPPSEAVDVPELPRAVTQLPEDEVPPPIPVVEDEPLADEAPPLPPMDATGQAAESPPDPRRDVMNRRIADAGGNIGPGSNASASATIPGASPVGADLATALGAAGATRTAIAQPTRLANPDGTMIRGTYLRCVLETRIISDLDGFASCVVTEPVYSFNGRHLLLPKGSKIFGRYAAGDFTNNRMAVVWDRVLTPSGVDVTISAPGVDNLGSSGMPGQYSAHWARRISGALMISLLSDAFKYYGAKEGPTQTGITSGGIITQEPFESNTAESIQRLAEQGIEENSRRPPTVTINQGTVVNIYVTQDIDFSNVLAMN
jgi:type IV secretion system protein VirB10